MSASVNVSVFIQSLQFTAAVNNQGYNGYDCRKLLLVYLVSLLDYYQIILIEFSFSTHKIKNNIIQNGKFHKVI